jgi:lactoylglutathione lyase
MITRMNHSGLVVKDIDASIAFYSDALGMEVAGVRERDGGPIEHLVGYRPCHLKAVDMAVGDGSMLELLQYFAPSPADRPTEERSVLGGSHVAFDVVDIQDVYERLLRHGARKLNPPIEGAPGKWVCYLQDPDGNWIELIELTTSGH